MRSGPCPMPAPQLNDALRDYHARRAEAARLRGEIPTILPAGDVR